MDVASHGASKRSRVLLMRTPKSVPAEGVEEGVVLTEGEYKIRPYVKRPYKTVGATLVVARFSTPSPCSPAH